MLSRPTSDSSSVVKSALSRRALLQSAVAASAGALLTGCASMQGDRKAPAVGNRLPDKIRVGVIGCGGRGTGAAKDAATASRGIEIVALGDLIPERLDSCEEELKKLGDAYQVKADHKFSGFDAYKHVLSAGVDLVILATPPGFRPIHFKAAVDAGKHIFMEKPVAVDPVGVRSVIATAEQATNKGLCVVTGTQRRHDPVYLETMRRIHRGDIGKIVAAQCYWNQGDLWVFPKKDEWSEMEWQCRNWLYFDWLSGDHIVEQHVHNIDVVNWALQATPVKCMGVGGRQWRTGPEYGNIWDHFGVEYEYPNGVRVLSMCRQTKGASERVSERIVGTNGTADPHGTIYARMYDKDDKPRARWKFEQQGEAVNPYVQEHTDLVRCIRTGKYINEAKRVAESTMTAIMGRMSAYTGRELSWDWVMNASKLDLSPEKYEFGPHAVNPVPVPGETKLVMRWPEWA